MHCSPDPPEENHDILKTFNSQCKRNKSKLKNTKRRNNFSRKKIKFAASMSSWAENFTLASTWQLKHQAAYWKAKATALEYENKVLHDLIRKNHGHSSSEQGETISDSETDLHCVGTTSNHEEEEDESEEEFEVSEEYIEFLRENAKYKEDARLERERLKAKNDFEQRAVEEMEAGPSKVEDSSVVLKDLYGAEWQRIGALETSLHTQFVHECDEEKPPYWPNIPFNFNFS